MSGLVWYKVNKPIALKKWAEKEHNVSGAIIAEMMVEVFTFSIGTYVKTGFPKHSFLLPADKLRKSNGNPILSWSKNVIPTTGHLTIRFYSWVRWRPPLATVTLCPRRRRERFCAFPSQYFPSRSLRFWSSKSPSWLPISWSHFPIFCFPSSMAKWRSIKWKYSPSVIGYVLTEWLVCVYPTGVRGVRHNPVISVCVCRGMDDDRRHLLLRHLLDQSRLWWFCSQDIAAGAIRTYKLITSQTHLWKKNHFLSQFPAHLI